MQRWEYETREVGDSVIKEALDQLGDDGWELVAVSQIDKYLYRFFFKRPKP